MNTETSGHPGPVGLAGWLVLIGLGLIISPILLANYLLDTFPPIFRDGTWQVLTTPGPEPYHPFWAPLLLSEIVINCLFIVASIVLLFMYFQKSGRFPKIYIYYLIANVAFILTDALAVRIVLPEEPIFDPDTVREFGRSLINATIWIPYILVSKRVRNTFAPVAA
jgi:hypothetical protein